MKQILTSTIFILFAFLGQAQNALEAEFYKKMDLGVELMDQGKYEQADEQFRYVLNNMSKLPSEMAYYFGKNSFNLKKYKQSINWLNKYVQLKGTSGRFYENAVEVLHLAEEAYLAESKARKESYQEDLMSGEFDCDGLAKMICPVCKGEGVIIKQGPFDKIYQTCPYSAGESYLTCEEYNLFMKGELKPKIK